MNSSSKGNSPFSQGVALLPGIIHFQCIKLTEPVSRYFELTLCATLWVRTDARAQLSMLTIRLGNGFGDKAKRVILQVKMTHHAVHDASKTPALLAVGLQHSRGGSGRFKERKYFSPVLALNCKPASSNAASAAHAESDTGTQRKREARLSESSNCYEASFVAVGCDRAGARMVVYRRGVLKNRRRMK